MLGFVAAVVSSVFTGTICDLSRERTTRVHVVIVAAMAILSSQILSGADRLSSFNLVMYMSPVALVYLLPFAAIFEFPALFGEWMPQHGNMGSIAMLLVSGVIAVLLSIRRTD
jgi:hypothetical protein